MAEKRKSVPKFNETIYKDGEIEIQVERNCFIVRYKKQDYFYSNIKDLIYGIYNRVSLRLIKDLNVEGLNQVNEQMESTLRSIIVDANWKALRKTEIL